MTFIWIIVAVISFIFYIAQSVEKQNAEEQKRRMARRSGQRSRTMPQKAPVPEHAKSVPERTASEPESISGAPMANEWRRKYREAGDRLAKVLDARQQVPGKLVEVSSHVPESPARKVWIKKDRNLVRQAFIFSECIGKPRAVQPHRYFRRH